MQEVIPFIALMEELYFIFDLHIPKLETFCEVFKDNQSCIDVADSNKLPPKTKYITIKYHHLQSFVQKKIIQIC